MYTRISYTYITSEQPDILRFVAPLALWWRATANGDAHSSSVSSDWEVSSPNEGVWSSPCSASTSLNSESLSASSGIRSSAGTNKQQFDFCTVVQGNHQTNLTHGYIRKINLLRMACRTYVRHETWHPSRNDSADDCAANSSHIHIAHLSTVAIAHSPWIEKSSVVMELQTELAHEHRHLYLYDPPT